MTPFRVRVRSAFVVSTTILFIIGISANAGRLLLRRAPNLTLARSAHAAAPLRGGEVLIVGGWNGTTPIADSEIFSLADGTMYAGPRAIYARAEHTATALRDGSVLVTGGRDAAMPLDTAELYDARTHAFGLAGRMTTARSGHTATLLGDGRVLIAGNGTAEVFDPETREFAAVDARMNVARSGHSAILLADGRVLIAGGRDAKGNAIGSAEVFNGNSFIALAAMKVARVAPTLRALPDGKVQVIGGDKDATMEIFDPANDAFTAKAVIDRAEHPSPQARIAIIDAAFEPIDAEVRHGATITKVDNATVITGGASRNGATNDVTVVPDRAWVTTKTSEVEAGKNVEITAGGFEPGEAVTLALEHNSDGSAWKTIELVADGEGNVATTEKIAKDAKDETLTATATGGTSKYSTISSWRVTPFAPVRDYSASIDKTCAQNNVAQAYTVTITNSAASAQKINSASVTKGSGFNNPTSVSVTTPVGTWSVSNVSGTITVTSPGNASDLAPGTSLTITFTSTPSATGAKTFVTSATDGTAFNNTGTDPVVTVQSGACVVATTLTVNSVTVGYGGTTSMTATLTQTSGGAGISGKSISFTLNGSSVGSATTNASGVATLASATLPKTNVGTLASGAAASFAGDASFSTSSATNSLTVTARAITVTAATNTKTYDSTTTAAATPTVTVGSLAYTDTGSFTETYDNKNVGTGKTMTPAGSVNDGNSGNNYTVTFATSTNGVINARALTVTAATNTKTYDATTSAAATPTVTSGTIQGSDTANFTEVYSDKNAGTGKTLIPSGTVTDGNSGNNYTYTFANNVTGVINARALTVTAASNTKTYDATTSAAATPTVTSGTIQGSDTANFTEVYSDKNAGTGKTLIPSGTVTDGNSGNNYSYTFVNNVTSVINARALTVTAATNTKTYDATTSAAATPTVTSGTIQGSDTANFTEVYNNKNAGTGKTLTPSGTVSDGNSGNNYTYTFVNNVTGVINARALTITAATNTKTYDATTSAAATPTVTSGTIQGSDTANFTEVYSDKNAGTGKTLIPSGTVTDGNSGNNYTYTFVNNVTGVISARALTVTAATNTKTYDGTTSAAATPTVTSGTIQGSDVANFTEVYNNKNAGSGKTLIPSGTVTDGNSGNNYAYTFVNDTTGVINARAITVTASANAKTYDGTTSAAAIPTVTAGAIQTGDTANFTEVYDDKNVGTGKTLTPSGSVIDGNSGSNYTYTFTSTTNGTINVLAITVTAATNTKTYDGTTSAAATPTVTAGAIQTGDTANFTEVYDDKNVGTGKTLTPSGSVTDGNSGNNYSVTFVASTNGVINARALTISATASNKTYDGNANASVTLSDNRVSGDVFTDSFTTATFADKSVGNGKTVTVSGISISGTDAGNYTFNTSTTTTADITARTLTVSAAGVNKTYDGTDAATVTLSNDRVSGDDVTNAYTTATFDTKNAGTGKTVSVSGITISGGADAGNYSLGNSTASTTADITAASVVPHITADDKTYDGTTDATILTRTLTGVINPDVVALDGGTASFDTKHVGTNKTVTGIGFSLIGADAGNYVINPLTATTTASITARTLTVTAHASNKTYDGNANASVTFTDDRVSGDDVTYTYATALFSDKNAGTGKTVSVTGIAINGGTDGGDYVLASSSASTTADITARALNVTATASNKTYDGNTTASVTLLDDRLGGDDVLVTNSSATFDTKHVGTGKTVTVNGISIVGGADQNNYALANTSTTTTANITKRDLNVTATASNKTYDGNTTASVTLSDDRLTGDDVTLGYTSATFDTKHAGTGKTVTVSGISITGGLEGGDYALVNSLTTATANITARSLNVTATASNKTYDATTAATATLLDDRLTGDDVTLAYTSATFDTKNVGNGKTVTVSGISITGGTEGNDYALANTSTTTTANITQRALTVTANASNKTYDGNTTATVTLSDDHISGDVVVDNYTSAVFDDKNVGTNKNVTVSGISITGADATNYLLSNTTALATADITSLTTTPTVTAANRVYDQTTAATILTRTLSNIVSGDDVSLIGGTANFNNKNAGTGKLVTVTGLSLSGADAPNYALSSTTATTTANITPKTVTPVVTVFDKIYDRTTAATINTRSLTGVIAGDNVTLTGGTATFSNKNVGNGKIVTITGLTLNDLSVTSIGEVHAYVASVGNYVLSSTSTTATASITPRDLHASATASNKVYDGNTTASVTLSDDRLTGDVITLGYTSATFDTKHAGNGKTVTVSGISITGGADQNNYALFNTSTTATANITQRDLHVTATASNKAYDGNTTASVTLNDDRVSGDAVTLGYTSATFDTKNVGNGKTVTVSGISITGGTDAGDYALFNTSTTATANITLRDLHATATASNKVYDGNTTASATLFDDRVSGDDVTLGYTTATFDTKHAGNGKTVTVSGISITGGADQNNYSLFNTSTTTTANITQRDLHVTATASNKTYDGNTTASVTLLDDRVSGDAVTLGYTSATFATKNVGTGKTVTVSGISITGGTEQNDYSLFNTSTTATADITARTLNITAIGSNKVYDGTNAATVSFNDDRVSGDVFNVIYTTATFSSKTVGNGKTITVTGISLSGTDAGNYTVTNSTTATANITALSVSPVVTVNDKTYDGTTAATINTRSLTGAIGGDDVSLVGGTATFATKTAGTNKLVNITGLSLSGSDAGNYVLSSTSTTATANINAATVIPTVTVNNKPYDGTTAATINTRSLSGVINPDVVTLTGGVANFSDSAIGTGKTVTITGLTLGGADAGNYVLSSTTTTATADITGVILTVTATAANKVYDGNTTATVTLSDNRQSGTNITVNYTAANFNNKNVGNGKTVTVTGLSISGPDAGGYQLASTTITTTANITPASLMVSAQNASRQYSDPNPSFSVTYSGFVGGDTASNLSSPPVCTSTAALSTPGTYPITCGSAGASNYTITYFSGTLTVTAEDARVFYTGLLSASTSSPTSGTATLTLAATVKDITAFPADPQFDATAGVISNAKVTFRDVVRGTTLCTANVGLDGSDQKVGTATCNATVNIGTASSATYTVGLVVGSYYIRNNSADNVIVTVSKQVSHPISGSGTLTLTSSGGTKAGDAGSTTTLTFTAQYSGSAITGNFDLIFKRTESSVLRTYEIKGTVINELLTGSGKASFNATSVSVLDITNPTPVTLDSNATLTLTFTDNGGSGDAIGITAMNKTGGIWFSSKFDGTATVEQVLATGDCVIN